MNNFSLSSRRRRVVKGRSVFRNTGRLLWPVISLALSNKHTTQLPAATQLWLWHNQWTADTRPSTGSRHCACALALQLNHNAVSRESAHAHRPPIYLRNYCTTNDCACAHHATETGIFCLNVVSCLSKVVTCLFLFDNQKVRTVLSTLQRFTLRLDFNLT